MNQRTDSLSCLRLHLCSATFSPTLKITTQMALCSSSLSSQGEQRRMATRRNEKADGLGESTAVNQHSSQIAHCFSHTQVICSCLRRGWAKAQNFPQEWSLVILPSNPLRPESPKGKKDNSALAVHVPVLSPLALQEQTGMLLNPLSAHVGIWRANLIILVPISNSISKH